MAKKKETKKREAPFPGWNPTPQRSGWRNLLGCILWPTLILGALGATIWGIWQWHPWEYRAETIAVGVEACPETGNGVKSSDQLYVLGIPMGESGTTVICVDNPK